jgi:hypothetical protein
MKAPALILLVLASLAGYGQSIPANLTVPDGNKLLLHAYARGVQMYVCSQDPKDTSRYVWNPVGPQATLYSKDDYRQQVGKHYLNATSEPTWESTDGSKVSATKVQQAAAPDAGDIPWLLLKTTDVAGFGPLRATTFIQRLRTKGGLPSPGDANIAHKGQYVRINYTAEYLFYGPK